MGAVGGGIPDGLGPHVFVDDLDRPQLLDDDRHHLERALRVRAGEGLTISDGRGSWRTARMGDPIEPVGPVVMEDRPAPALGIAFALVKGERPELVTQKLTELGVDRIIPFLAERSVVRWDTERGTRHLVRLRRVAREAAMQCRRSWLPEIGEAQTFAAVAALPGAVRADRHGEPPSLDHPLVLVGPEGGWSAAERALVPGQIGLGAQVLRAETAAIAAATLLGALRFGLVGPPGRH